MATPVPFELPFPLFVPFPFLLSFIDSPRFFSFFWKEFVFSTVVPIVNEIFRRFKGYYDTVRFYEFLSFFEE